MKMREARCISASTTCPYVLFRVRNRQQPTVFTGVTREGVGTFHQPLFRKLRHSMRYHAITLHFSDVLPLLPYPLPDRILAMYGSS